MAGLGFSYGNIKLASAGFGIHDAFRETNCDTSFLFLVSLVSAWFVGSMIGFSDVLFNVQDLFWCDTILLQLIALQSIIVFISFICAKAPAAIAASVCFTFITCNLLRNFLHGKIFECSCFCIARNNAYETLIPASIAAILTCMITILLTYLVFCKKEIK